MIRITRRELKRLIKETLLVEKGPPPLPTLHRAAGVAAKSISDLVWSQMALSSEVRDAATQELTQAIFDVATDVEDRLVSGELGDLGIEDME